MKTTDPRDSLDRKIDALLSEQPLRAPEDFGARALEAAEAPQRQVRRRRAERLIRFALPAAAAMALALFFTTPSREPTDQLAQHPQDSQISQIEAPLENIALEELFRLQEGLAGLATIPQDTLDSEELLQTLDTLEFGFES